MKEIQELIRKAVGELNEKTDRLVFEALSKDPEFREYIESHYYIELRGDLRFLRKIGTDSALVSWTETIRIQVGDKIEEITI